MPSMKAGTITLDELRREIWRRASWWERLRWVFWQIVLWPEFQIARWRLRRKYGRG